MSPGASTARRKRRAIVVGGSIAGLFTAAFLRRIGWQADVYERSSIELTGRGVGIFATHSELLEALDKCGAGTVDIGVIACKRVSLDLEGEIIAEKRQLQIVTSWDRLRKLLAKAVDLQRYHFGYAFERVEQDGSEVVVSFANGRTERADLLVACDGFRSAVRAQIAPQVQPIYAGYYIWRGAANEGELSPRTRATIFPYFSVFAGEHQHVIGYPISGIDDDLRAGHRRYNFAWFRIADADELKQTCIDEEGRPHEFTVPPALVRKDLIARMRAEAESLLPPQLRDCVQHIDQPFITPVCDFCSPNLVSGRVVFVGDAASTSRPHLGFGVAKAGAEAQSLAEALDAHEHIDRALTAYDIARQRLSERILEHGRKLGTHLGVNLVTEEDRRMSKLLQRPGAMLDWIAVPDFLATRRPAPVEDLINVQ
jgi:2-polyprenyl-6-methoxyphenol hydroxylase-like FAD-dependent oxidoreductase